jgi:hypothetical protein
MAQMSPHIEQILAPTLAPGDVVVLDNLSNRCSLNSHLMRNAQPRDVEAIWRKVGELLDLFSSNEGANYIVNSGYGSV